MSQGREAPAWDRTGGGCGHRNQTLRGTGPKLCGPCLRIILRGSEVSSFQLPCPVWPENLPGREERPWAGGARNGLHPHLQGNVSDGGALGHSAAGTIR